MNELSETVSNAYAELRLLKVPPEKLILFPLMFPDNSKVDSLFSPIDVIS